LTGPPLALIGLMNVAVLYVSERACVARWFLSLENPSSAKAFHDVKPARSRGPNAA